MTSTKFQYLKEGYKNFLWLFIFLIPLHYLKAQRHQQDTTTIGYLSVSAKSKRFKDTVAAFTDAHEALVQENMMSAHRFGQLLMKKQDYRNAVQVFKKNIAFAEKALSKFWLQKNYIQLSAAYERMKQPDSSLFYLKKAIILKDSLYEEESNKRIVEAQFKYDLSENENEMTQMRNRNIRIIIVAIIAFFLMLLVFFSYFLQNNKEKNRMLMDKNEAIEDKNQQLGDANEILRQFAFASAHDLKEPLRGINSFINIIQKKYVSQLPLEANEYMSFVTTGVKRMNSLLDALLEFSSVLSKDSIEAKHNDIPLILHDIFHQNQNLINEKNAIFKYPSSFPKPFMNEDNLRKLMTNLVLNALKFSKEQAKIEIDWTKNDSEYIFFVKDQGIGIDPSYGNKIFKLFQRLDISTKGEGVGVGLTICKNIVARYKGRIWFESILNEGATFYVAFPKAMILDKPPKRLRQRYRLYY